MHFALEMATNSLYKPTDKKYEPLGSYIQPLTF